MTAQDLWTAGGAGLWSVDDNWSLGRPPGTGDIAEIEATTPFVVSFANGDLTLGGLTLDDATLTMQSGELNVTGSANFDGATVNGSAPLVLKGQSAISGLTVGGSVVLYNRGQVTQSAGSVTIGDSATSNALVYNYAGATWTITDASGMTAGNTSGWRFVNYGTLQKTSTTGLAWIYANVLSTGTIASAAGGDIVFDGRLTRLSGTYIGAGMVDYGPDGTAIVGPVQVTQASCQSNFGVVDLTGDMTVYDGSTIMNAKGAQWNFDGDSSILLAAGQSAGPDINGPGAVAKIAGAGTSEVSVDAELEGTVNVETGTLAFEGASSQFSGAVSGAGTFEIAGGDAQILAGASFAVAHWTLAGGETTLAENVAYKGAFGGDAGATLALGGDTLTLTGAANLAGLDLTGAGSLGVQGATSVSGGVIGGTVRLLDSGMVTQALGNLTLGDATATDQASLTIGNGGVWDIDDNSAILGGADPLSSLNIGAYADLLEKTGTGVAKVAPNVVNNGTNVSTKQGLNYYGVAAKSGTLDFAGAVSGTGTDNVVGAATLEFDGTVSAGQRVAFHGADGVLDLTDLAGFHSAIVGFDTAGSADAILIAGGWSYGGASESATAATLSFTGGGAPASLVLTGDYVGGAFSAQSLTGGVLKITF